MLKSRPRAPKSPSRRPRTDGVPLLGSVFSLFCIDFWFALDLHFHRYFDWIFPRVFREQSWDEGFFLENRGRDPRAFFRQNAVNFGDFWMTGHKSSAVAGTPRSGALDKDSIGINIIFIRAIGARFMPGEGISCLRWVYRLITYIYIYIYVYR